MAVTVTRHPGREGVRDFWGTWHQLFDGFRLEIEDCAAVGDDRVVVTARAHGMGAESGVPVTSPRFIQTLDFRADRVVHASLRALRRPG